MDSGRGCQEKKGWGMLTTHLLCLRLIVVRESIIIQMAQNQEISQTTHTNSEERKNTREFMLLGFLDQLPASKKEKGSLL